MTEKSWGIAIGEFLYLTIVGIFIYKLIALNKILIETFDANDHFGIVFFNNNQPLYYFFIAFILFVLGGITTFFLIRHFFKQHLYEYEPLIIGGAVLLNIILMWQIFHHINNPILRALLIVVAISVGAATVVSSK